MQGERDFYGIELEYNFDLSGHELFGKMQNYLRNEYLKSNPVVLSNSDFAGVRASGLYLPYLQAEHAILWNSNFEYSIFDYANFHYAELTYGDFKHTEIGHADFRNSDLRHVNFEHANLYFSDFSNANFDFTQLFGADLVLADLRGAKNLERSFNLRCAIFAESRVTQREETIVRNASQNVNLFDVER